MQVVVGLPLLVVLISPVDSCVPVYLDAYMDT